MTNKLLNRMRRHKSYIVWAMFDPYFHSHLKKGLKQGLVETLGVEGVCAQLGMDEKNTRMYVQIAKKTRLGKLGPEIFKLNPGETLSDRLSSSYREIGLSYYPRMYADNDFRDRTYEFFKTIILPRAKKITLGLALEEIARQTLKDKMDKIIFGK